MRSRGLLVVVVGSWRCPTAARSRRRGRGCRASRWLRRPTRSGGGSIRSGSASPAASLSRCSLEPRVLLVAPRLLALLSLGLLRGQVLLDRGRGDPRGELVERGATGQLLRLVDALAVGVRQAGGVGEPLRDEQAQDDRERVLGRAGALERGQRLRRGAASRPARRAGSGRSPCPACSSSSAARRRAGAPRPPPCRGAGGRASRAA